MSKWGVYVPNSNSPNCHSYHYLLNRSKHLSKDRENYDMLLELLT